MTDTPEVSAGRRLHFVRVATDNFTVADWKKLAITTHTEDYVKRHARLLRSLHWGDADYESHVIDAIDHILAADAANLDLLETYLRNRLSQFRLPERFLQHEELGCGGYGRVHRVTDTLLGLDFALKVLDPSPFLDTDAAARFLREARLLFRLNHPNIVRVYDVGELDGKPYIRMEYVDGATLNDTGAVGAERARQIIRGVLSGLESAHGVRVLHRDIKPSNVMVRGNEVKIIDFGLGAFVEEALNKRLTSSDERPVGGPFADPVLVHSPRTRDPRCDLYSVAAVWFWLLTGRTPHAETKVEYLDAVDVPRADRDLVLATLGALERRPENATQMLRAMASEQTAEVAERDWSSTFTPDVNDKLVLAAVLAHRHGEWAAAESVILEKCKLAEMTLFEIKATLASLAQQAFIKSVWMDEAEETGYMLTNEGESWTIAHSAAIARLEEQKYSAF